MIEDFHDNEHERVIPLGAMGKQEAIEHLISLGIAALTAKRHVENSLGKFKCGGLDLIEATQLLVEMGHDPIRAKSLALSDLYDSLSLNYSNNHLITHLEFTSHMDDGLAKLMLNTETDISLQNLISLLTPRDQQIYPSKLVFHDHHTQFNRLSPIYSITIYFNDDEETIINVLEHIFNKLFTINAHYELHDALDKCIEFAKCFCIAKAMGFPHGNYYLRRPQSKEPVIEEIQTPSLNACELKEAICRRNLPNVHELLRSGVNPNESYYGYPLIKYIFPNDHEQVATGTILSIFKLS